MANQIEDPSFEVDDPATRWTVNTGSAVSADTEHFHTGAKAMKVTNGGTTWAAYTQITAAEAGNYTYSVWAFNPDTNTDGVYLRVGGGAVSEPQTGPEVDTKGAWVPVSHTVTVTGSGLLTLYLFGPDNQTIWVDDVYGGPEIVPTGPGAIPPLTESLNKLAGTTGLAAQGAANAWAGTTNLSLVDALNSKAGNTSPIALQGVLNQLAATSGLGIAEAASRIEEE